MTSAQLAKSCGYTGQSPAMLNAFEQIRIAGIREARASHYERKRIVDQYKADSAMFFNAIRPSLTTSEAIEDANRIIFTFRNLEKWKQERRLPELRRAKRILLIARFFRRYGARIWAREAA